MTKHIEQKIFEPDSAEQGDVWIDQEELIRYGEAVGARLRGELDEERFMAVRLQQGIYGQRQEGVNMIRIKLPGGRISPQQLKVVADVLADHSQENIASVTTRQDLQLHTIPLGETPEVLQKLADIGLTSREACGNTVRNITACPLAGVCPKEHADVLPVVEAVSKRFIRHPLTQHLPRKFKMSFSGCESDCAQGLFHDLAVVAVQREGRLGFQVLAAGGLGHKPRQAIVVEDFITEQELLPVIEAVLALHHRHSDRKKRARARLKFLVDRLGEEEFLEKYQEELSRTREVYARDVLPAVQWNEVSDSRADIVISAVGAPRKVLEQKQAGYFVLPISLPLGDLTADAMHGIADILLRRGLDDVRATQDQNLMIVNIRQTDLEPLKEEIQALGLVQPTTGDDVVSCPGTWTCRLGITASRKVSNQLSGSASDLRIRVSGCHNGCAQPTVGDIGLHGEGRRLHGKLIPHYRMHFGGDGRASGAIAIKGPEIPVVRSPVAVKRVQEAYHESRQNDELFTHWARRQEKDFFNILLEDLTVVTALDVPVLVKDVGEADEFRVLNLGGGECMGAAQENVSANFSEAKYEREYRRVFWLAKKFDQALDCAEAIAVLVGKSLLEVAGEKMPPASLPGIASKLDEVLHDQTHLGEGLAVFSHELNRLRAVDDDVVLATAFERLIDAQDVWTILAAEVCQARDPQLVLDEFIPEVQQLAKVS